MKKMIFFAVLIGCFANTASAGTFQESSVLDCVAVEVFNPSYGVEPGDQIQFDALKTKVTGKNGDVLHCEADSPEAAEQLQDVSLLVACGPRNNYDWYAFNHGETEVLYLGVARYSCQKPRSCPASSSLESILKDQLDFNQ